MKRLAAYLLTGVLVLSMTACGGNNTTSNESTMQSSETADSEPTQNSQSASVETESSTAPEETVPEETIPEENTELTSSWSTEMEAIKTAIVDAIGENYWPNTPIPAEVLEGSFGITADMYDDYMGEMPMISVNVDTLLIIKAKDDKVEDVEAALNTYRDNLINDTMQYPMNVGKIQASRIERIGNYVCFVQLGADTTAAAETGDEAVITQCQEQNELVIEVISQNVQH